MPGPLYPPSRASTASAPITAIERDALRRAAACCARSCSSTIDARAASRASARCSACPFQYAALSASTYGCSNSPSSNFARSTRATAASITESAISPRRNASRYGRCCGHDDWKMTSRPASSACFVAVAVLASVCAAPSRRPSPRRRRSRSR